MTSYIQKEKARFTELNGQTCIRAVGTTGTNSSVLSHVENLKRALLDNSNNDAAIRIKITN